MHKFVRLKPKSAQNCKHNILEYFSSVSYFSLRKAVLSLEILLKWGGGKANRQMEKFPSFTHLGMGEESSRRHAVLLCNTKASQYKNIFDLL